jgi:hypothetical protein
MILAMDRKGTPDVVDGTAAEQVVGNKRVTLRAGVPHPAFVKGTEPFPAVISYSSCDRQVVNYGKTEE